MSGDIDQLLAIGVQQLAILLHQLETVGMIRRPVGAIEGTASGNDGCDHIFARGVRRLADDFTGPGADVVVGLVARGAANLAVDIKLGFRKGSHDSSLAGWRALNVISGACKSAGMSMSARN